MDKIQEAESESTTVNASCENKIRQVICFNEKNDILLERLGSLHGWNQYRECNVTNENVEQS